MGKHFNKNERLKILVKYTVLSVVILSIQFVSSNPTLILQHNNNNNQIKWTPIRDFKSNHHPESMKTTNQADFMNSSESIERPSMVNNQNNQLLNIENQNSFIRNQQQQMMPACASLFREQILQALHAQAQAQQQQLQQQQQTSSLSSSSAQNQRSPELSSPNKQKDLVLIASSSRIRNQNNNAVRKSRALIDSHYNQNENENTSDDDESDMEDEGTGNELMPSKDSIEDKSSRQVFHDNNKLLDNNNNNFENDNNRAELGKLDSSLDEQQANELANDEMLSNRNEQEAMEASEKEAADKSALDEQQQQQREIILAQAEHEAKAIKEQQELLLKQQKLQQQVVQMRDRNDLNSNNSDPQTVSSLVDRKNLINYEQLRNFGLKTRNPKQKQTSDIQFSDQPYFESDKLVDQANELIQEENKPKVSSSDLIPSAQHNYGAHYGALTKHQNHYYQYAESHKKGQYESGFKRGNKKFKISGHSSQHKSHAEGHVKWKSKKGKGTHYWDYKHKDKKHHHGHHHY